MDTRHIFRMWISSSWSGHVGVGNHRAHLVYSRAQWPALVRSSAGGGGRSGRNTGRRSRRKFGRSREWTQRSRRSRDRRSCRSTAAADRCSGELEISVYQLYTFSWFRHFETRPSSATGTTAGRTGHHARRPRCRCLFTARGGAADAFSGFVMLREQQDRRGRRCPQNMTYGDF
jgi:hypothetical protein